jgi:hypothetical protein
MQQNRKDFPMIADSITLNTATYDLIKQGPTSAVRSNGAQPIEAPHIVTVSHETLNDGRVSSVVIADAGENITCSTSGINTEHIKAMIKLQYNPKSGVTGLEAKIEEQIAVLQSFLSNATLLAKFLNRES